MIYTRKENIDFDLPCFHSGTCLMCLEGQERPNERARERKGKDSRSLFFLPMFSWELSRENEFVSVQHLPYLFLFIVSRTSMNMEECARSFLLTWVLEISFPFFAEQYAFDYFQVLICVFVMSLLFFLSLSHRFDHRIVDTYVDDVRARAHLFSLSYFRACVVKAIMIIPD